ncbi:MAG: alpha/beta hydrolase [Pirellulaceae bacterium]|nr:alpha/beta hydrolase [Pirellulaceae bacterium]
MPSRRPGLFIAFALAWVLPAAAALVAAEPARVLRDVAYKPAAESDDEPERCRLDLYLPAAGKSFPTLVWFHGGGLTGGDKAAGYAPALGRRFAGEGIAMASVNYRLSPRVKYPAYVDDGAAAVAFVRGEIAKHGGAAERVFVAGHSAGGYLTAMIGLDSRYLAKYQLQPSDLAGLIPVSGQMVTHSTVRAERGIPKTRPLIDEAAPAFHVRADSPPWLVFAGSEDLPTRAEENRYFVAALKAAGHKNATYLEIAGRDHGTIASQLPERDDAVAKRILEFIRQEGGDYGK